MHRLTTRSFLLAVLSAASLGSLSASAGWTFDSSKKTLSDDVGNWVLTVTFPSKTTPAPLTVTGAKQGTGALDLTDFVGPNGETIVAFKSGVYGYKAYTSCNFETNGLTSVKLPATVTKIESGSFCNCPDLVEVDIPEITQINQETFRYCPSLKSVVFPKVKYVGYSAFQGCTSLESVSFPSIVTLGGTTRYKGVFDGVTNLMYVTFGPDLETINIDAFSGCKGIRVAKPDCLPKLTKICANAFDGALAASDLVFPTNLPALTTIDGQAFRYANLPELDLPALTKVSGDTFAYSQLRRFTARNLTKIDQNGFRNANSLKEVYFSHKLTSIGSGAFPGTLTWFEPFFPTNLASTASNASYGSSALTNTEVVCNFTNQTTIGDSFCEKLTKITRVTFFTDVTSIGKSAFKNLQPSAKVIFHGPSKPTLGDKAIYYNGESNDKRVVITFDHPDARSGWLSAVSPNADTFETYKEKIDYPGEKTIGLLTLGTATVSKKTVNVYAWVVDEAPVSDKGTLVVHGVPDAHVPVSPDYGLHNDVVIGSTTTCTAPAAYTNDGYAATLAGYVVSNLNASGVYTFVAEGTGNAYSYVQGQDIGDLTWIWTDHHWNIRGQTQGGGTVEPSDRWVPFGETVTLTATPAEGMVFRFWTGEFGTVDCHQNPLTLTADQARTVTAVFGTPEAARTTWRYTVTDSTKKTGKLKAVSADGLDTAWSFYVSGETNELAIGSGSNMYESGGGVLDLREVTAQAGVTLRTVNLGNQNVGSTMPHETVTAIYLPESVTSVGDFSFKGLYNLETVSLPGVKSLGNRSFQNCSKLTSVELPSIVEMRGAMYEPTFGGCSALTNLFLGTNLTTVGIYALASLPQIGWLGSRTFPKLRLVDVCGMESLGSSCADPQLPTNFPALTSVERYAFKATAVKEMRCDALEYLPYQLFESSKLESFYGPSVRSVGDRSLNTEVFTNAVFSQALTNIHFQTSHEWLNPFGLHLRHLEPFLPTNLTCQLNSFTFGNSTMDATTELIWKFADRPIVPKGLFQYMTNLQSVVFWSNVTSIQQNAFLKLPPKARVVFHGPNMPAIGDKALYRDGETDDTRLVIEVCNWMALPAWREATAENDETYRTEYRSKKPDYPGTGTFGLLKLGTKIVNKKEVGIYAWVKRGKSAGLRIIVR